MTGGDEPSGDRGGGADASTAFGPVDRGALHEIRDVFLEMEPLVESATLDDPVNPQRLSVELSDGVGEAKAARFDVQWSLTGNYGFHYVDDLDRQFRFDRHPKPDAPTRHFHPPPDAPSEAVESSCITVPSVELATRAVLKRWRVACDRGTLDDVNDAENPP